MESKNEQMPDEQPPADSSLSNQEGLQSGGADNVPPEVLEALQELPPSQRQFFQSTFLAMAQMPSRPSSPLAKRVTSEHITQTLDNIERENEREFKKSQSSENTKRLGMFAILFLIMMVLVYAGITKDKDLAEKVIIAGISGIGGFGAGIAVSKKD